MLIDTRLLCVRWTRETNRLVIRFISYLSDQHEYVVRCACTVANRKASGFSDSSEKRDFGRRRKTMRTLTVIVEQMINNCIKRNLIDYYIFYCNFLLHDLRNLSFRTRLHLMSSKIGPYPNNKAKHVASSFIYRRTSLILNIISSTHLKPVFSKTYLSNILLANHTGY